MTTLRNRFKILLENCTPPRSRFTQLSEHSGIPQDSWKSVWHNRQRPTVEMIEAVAKCWPEYAFWLVSGITDQTHGHRAATPHTYPEPRMAERIKAADYFQTQLQILDKHLKGEPEKSVDFAELKLLLKRREEEEKSLLNESNESDEIRAARLLDEAEAVCDETEPSMLVKLIRELQIRRQLDDVQFCAFLGISEETLEHILEGNAPLPSYAKFKLIDNFGYLVIRDLLLKILPDNMTDRIKRHDNMRI